MQRLTIICTSAILLAWALPATADGPIPIGEADVTFSYMTDSGLRVLESSVDYSGQSSQDVIPLGGDPNIGYFNSVNSFGRRILVDGAVREEESLLTHSLFKPPGNSTEFFADIVEGAWLTLEVRNIHLDRPAWLQHDTVMMHKNWDADQVDRLPPPSTPTCTTTIPARTHSATSMTSSHSFSRTSHPTTNWAS